ncbi:MAG: hypothetical protein M3340_05410 [Actinomycetota bacterium]|nr:hypothetical protein [Actinomycetota bacterium]
MTDYLRPCVSLAAWSPRNGGYWGPSGFLSYGNHERYRESQTPWARFWVRWLHMQPRGRTDPALDNQPLVYDPWPGMTPQMITWQLDNQIAAARAAGLKIVLVVDEFPGWANGNGGSERPPALSNLGVDGDYAWFIRWLANRYSSVAAQGRGDNVYVDFLEVCNEPIHRWTRAGEDYTTAAHKAAQMMHTARAITANTGNQPIIAGPACSDANVDDLKTFINRMFDRFNTLGGWRGDQYVAWTQHNYVDCEANWSTCSNAVAARGKLHANSWGWRGWPNQDPNNPYILLTEGGARLTHVGGATQPEKESNQSTRVQAAWNTCKAMDGIGMFTQYQYWSHWTYDSGMLAQMDFADAAEPGLAPYPLQADGRKAYERPLYPAWKLLPTTAPRGLPSYPWNMHVCFIADGRLWHTIRFPTTWQQAGEIGVGKGPFISVDCAAIGRNLHVVAVSADGELWHTVRYPTTWQNFTPIDISTGGERGPWKAASCAAVNGELHVCAITQDGTPWHTIRFAEPGPGSGWQTFGSIEQAAGERGTFVDIDCTNAWRYETNGGTWIHELHVCGATLDGNAWHTIRHPTHWDGFGTLKFHFSDPGPIRKVSCAGKTHDVHVCVVTAEERIWHTIRVGDRWNFRTDPAQRVPAYWEVYEDVELLTGNERGAFKDADCANVAGDVHVMGVSQQAGRSDTEGWHTMRHAFGNGNNNPRWDGWGTLEGAVGERGNVTAVSASALFPS